MGMEEGGSRPSDVRKPCPKRTVWGLHRLLWRSARVINSRPRLGALLRPRSEHGCLSTQNYHPLLFHKVFSVAHTTIQHALFYLLVVRFPLPNCEVSVGAASCLFCWPPYSCDLESCTQSCLTLTECVNRYAVNKWRPEIQWKSENISV